MNPTLNQHVTLVSACAALTLVALGCATSEPDVRDDRIVTTVMTSNDTGYDYRRRGNERLYEAPVTSVRAVLGTTEERCWVERERVAGRPGANVGGAIAGAVIGGILGHQIGDGRGNDVATVGGAIAGGAIGANAGRANGSRYADVKHCETVVADSPEYWDVTYEFRGVRHRVQMTNPPGAYVMVNREGYPRV